MAVGAFFADAIYLVDDVAYRRTMIGMQRSDTIVWIMVGVELGLAFDLLFR